MVLDLVVVTDLDWVLTGLALLETDLVWVTDWGLEQIGWDLDHNRLGLALVLLLVVGAVQLVQLHLPQASAITGNRILASITKDLVGSRIQRHRKLENFN